MAETKGAEGYGIDAESAERCVPDSLYTFLQWLLCGPSEEGEGHSREKESGIHKKILNLGQEIVYSHSNGRKNTPKHIASGLLVHHVTRSKFLVDYLHAAGNSIGYDTILRIDTSIANAQIQKYVDNGMVALPPNISGRKFVQFSADNLDMIEETLDGRGTFHVTQMAAFERGPLMTDGEPQTTAIGRSKVLSHIPDEFHKLVTVEMPPGHVSPQSAELLEDAAIKNSFDTGHFTEKDLAFVLCRYHQAEKLTIPAWSGFNQSISQVISEPSIIGYLPIIPAPAHEMDTLMTVLLRCKAVSSRLGQRYTVVTFDEALYCRAKELVWLGPERLSDVVLRLGSFHIAMNYLGAIGQHMAGAGLTVWTESGVYSECTAEKMMKGKFWNRAVRGHKIVYEALQRLLLGKFFTQQSEDEEGNYEEIKNHSKRVADAFEEDVPGAEDHAFSNLVPLMNDFTCNFKTFLDSQENNKTLRFWRQYIRFIETLLLFIRAEREGIWDLHVAAFQRMLPLMVLYDHVNYTRWGTVYLIDMLQLKDKAPSVYEEFKAGNFVVKETEGKFNQVSTDLALEHINRTCKSAGGLVGITQTKTALDRWMLTCSDRAKVVEDACQLVNCNTAVKTQTQKELTQPRMRRDESDVRKVMDTLRDFNPFDRMSEDLICISSNEVLPTDVAEELLQAEERGSRILSEFIADRLTRNSERNLHDKIPQNKSKTFTYLQTPLHGHGSQQTAKVKCNKDIFKRLLSASQSGRQVDLANVLTYELQPAPPSLATRDGLLRPPTDKAALSHILADKYAKQVLPNSTESTCVVIDGMALVQSIGKPSKATTFGELADVFSSSVLKDLHDEWTRVDIIFDQYDLKSAKSGTRTKRNVKSRKVRRIIDRRENLLPSSWSSFIGLTENKQNLIQFLTSELQKKMGLLQPTQTLVIAGGMNDGRLVVSNHDRPEEMVKQHMNSTHEEADSRMILHVIDAANCGFERIIVRSRDTDVLVLLIHHKHRFNGNVWMSAGTSKCPRFIPINDVCGSLTPDQTVALPAYHAVTGCDTTSQFSGRGKKSTWKAFSAHPTLLKLDNETGEFNLNDAETFVMKIYSPSSKATDINDLRHDMFHRVADLEKLPPTRDSLKQHLLRSLYQCKIWSCAHIAIPDLPSIEKYGWKYDDSSKSMAPILMTSEPLPKTLKELLTCKCTTSKCSSSRCNCVKSNVACSLACACAMTCLNPNNLSVSEDNSSDSD